MAFPPAAVAQLTTITSASISATSNHSLCCGRPSGFAFPKLYLFRTTLSSLSWLFPWVLTHWWKCTSALPVTPSFAAHAGFVPPLPLCYNPHSHIWQIFALELNHTYHTSCIFSLISLQFAAVWLCPNRWFMPQKCYYPWWELTFHTFLASAHWAEFHMCFSSSSCLRLSWTAVKVQSCVRYKPGNTSAGSPPVPQVQGPPVAGCSLLPDSSVWAQAL